MHISYDLTMVGLLFIGLFATLISRRLVGPSMLAIGVIMLIKGFVISARYETNFTEIRNGDGPRRVRELLGAPYAIVPMKYDKGEFQYQYAAYYYPIEYSVTFDAKGSVSSCGRMISP